MNVQSVMGLVELVDSLTQFYIHRAVFNATLKLIDVPLAINILIGLEFLVQRFKKSINSFC